MEDAARQRSLCARSFDAGAALRGEGGMNRSAKVLVPILILILGVAGIFVAYILRPKLEPQGIVPQPPMVRVERVEPRQWQFVVRAHGSVKPRSQSDLIPQVSGQVVWVSPALVSGGFFGAGESLLRIDRADYEVALESARAAVARSRSEHERARKELARQKRLSARSVASENQFDDAVSGEEVTQAVLREAAARLEQAERDLDRTNVRAPYAGRVRDEEVDVGQFVARGTRVARIYAVDFAEVRLPLPDAELRFLDLPMLFRSPTERGDEGPEVILRAHFAGAEHEWLGRIVRTEGEIDAKSRMVNIVARVDDPYGIARAGDDDASRRMPLAVGLFVEAEILGRRLDAVFVVPRRALRENDRVLVVDADSRMHYRAVEVLRRERDQVVIGEGLAAGERVCVSPIQAVIDGMLVRVAGETPEAVSAATRGEDSST